MDKSSESEFLTPPANAIASTSASTYFSLRSESVLESRDSGRCNSIDEQIKKSQRHWSQLAEFDSDSDVDDVVDNVEVFKTLQMHPIWGCFFLTFGDGGEHDAGELVMGEKFAEGGQAELYHAQYKSWNPNWNVAGAEYVLKVFKKGYLLRHLKSQWPSGLLKFHAEKVDNWLRHFSSQPEPVLRHISEVMGGTLLEDGRFAFLMVKQHSDLRSLIDRTLESGLKCEQFHKEEKEECMYRIALGMDWLHKRNIVHRDLKASNILVEQSITGSFAYVVSDYECSVGVVGTEFWRAPEILQASIDMNVSQRPELFTTSADVYSYGMTCYEILTWKLPFEHHPLNDKYGNRLLIDHVINQHLRPEVPDFVDDWAHDLLRRCWQSRPATRPSVEEILSLLEANSNSDYIREMKAERRKADKVLIPTTQARPRTFINLLKD